MTMLNTFTNKGHKIVTTQAACLTISFFQATITIFVVIKNPWRNINTFTFTVGTGFMALAGQPN